MTRFLVNILLLAASLTCVSASSSSSITLRVRLADGSMERLQASDSLSLADALSPVTTKINDKKLSIRLGSSSTKLDTSKSLQELGLKSGSLLSLISNSSKKKKLLAQKTKQQQSTTTTRYDPFPDLAKDYKTAVRKRLARRSRGSSYADIADIQSAMHTVEPQAKGLLLRVYMCRLSAERFATKGGDCALLLGTFQRERIKARPRTSLSTPFTEQEYCTVAKVHALWEPPTTNKGRGGDRAAALMQTLKDKESKEMRVASWLGLEPVGWIFSYQDDRHEDDSLPVFAADIQTGASLQIANMQHVEKTQPRKEDRGARFLSLAMDGKTGATEAFQLSDVSVQMVAEDMILVDKKKNGRFTETKHSVIVDGKETTKLDSVLCLVNTAMLSHEGSFAGKSATMKKTGGLTKKARKAVSKALGKGEKEALEELCNFHTLVALYNEGLSDSDCERLCELVRKWARGQKKGTDLDERLKERLKQLVDAT